MSGKGWIYVGVLVTSVVAFAVDRALRSEPASAEAGGLSSGSEADAGPARPKARNKTKITSKTGQSAPRAPAAEPPPGADPILDWLERIPELPVSRDVFALSGSFLAQQRKLEEAVKQAQAKAEPAPDPGQTFASQRQLQSTLVGPGVALAVVNGEVLRIGEEIDGFTLTRVDAYRAEFRHQGSGQTVSLYLALLPD